MKQNFESFLLINNAKGLKRQLKKQNAKTLAKF